MTTTMTATGQVPIPESVRTAAGLVPGTPLEVSITRSGNILIKKVKKRRPLTREQIEAVRQIPRDFPWSSTDEFMAFIRGDDD
ncbi:MAG: AbrB/MazE/SpoVT family DNA-binding domain-containing protein [Rhodocyclaceae bacterium]|nr:AbrB/MazE/SpoVT family DNA-binding domain-containing protein [Rhodocyclaceae bacterium]